MSAWSEWKNVQYIQQFAGSYRWPGVYRLRTIGSDNNSSPFPIGRLFGIDKCGLLSIGESVNVARRIKEFNDACVGKVGKHPAGEKRFLFQILNAPRKDFTIQFSARRTKDKTEARKQQGILQLRYFRKHGELPPLNSNFGGVW